MSAIEVCPGSCNQAWRTAEANALRAAAAAERDGRRPTSKEREAIEHKLTPRQGEPVWCGSCQDRIWRALHRLPELLVGLWDVGHVTPLQGGSLVVAVRAVEVVEPRIRYDLPVTRRVALIAQLSCRHRTTIGGVDQVGRPVACSACALSQPFASGGLAPAAAAARRTHSKVTGSPAGSASWLAIDEVGRFLTSTAARLQKRIAELGHDAGTPQRPWSAGSDDDRNAAVTQAVRTLAERWTPLMSSPDAARIGAELLDLERRMTAAAGAGRSTRLPVPCPKCDRKSLHRSDDDEVGAWCSACGAYATLDLLDRMDVSGSWSG